MTPTAHQCELFPEPDEPRRVRPGDEYDPDEKEMAAFEKLRDRMLKELKPKPPKGKPSA